MAYSPYYVSWVDAIYGTSGNLVTPSPTPFTAAAATWYDSALASALIQTTKGDLVGYTGSSTVRVPIGANGTLATADSTQPAGWRWASQAAVTGAVYTSVLTFNAVGDGVTDDTSAIQQALNSVGPGGTVYFPDPPGGSYRTSAPLDVPPNVTLLAQHGDTLIYTGANPSPNSIKPLASFTGTAVFTLRDKTMTGASTDYVGTRFVNITIEGSVLTTGTVDGVQLSGLVRECTFENVTVHKVPGTGFACKVNASNVGPQSLRFRGCVAHDVGVHSFSLVNTPDTTMIDCNSEGAGSHGFYLQGLPNGVLIGCRAEWSGQYGYYVTSGYWGTGQGSGGLNMLACLTDRNNFDGVYVDSAATGAAQIQLTGCTFRRDGRAGGTTYAAVRASGTTMPVIVDNIATYPGLNDDGTGNLSPYTAVSATNATSVVVSSGYLHAVTVPTVNGGGNGAFVVSPGVGTATGSGSGPTRVAPVGSAPAVIAAVVKTASYTLALTDMNGAVEMNVAGANSVTVPPNSTVPFPLGATIEIVQYGAGQTTIAPGAGVTLRSSASLTTRAQYAVVSVRQRALNEWIVGGDLT